MTKFTCQISVIDVGYRILTQCCHPVDTPNFHDETLNDSTGKRCRYETVEYVTL